MRTERSNPDSKIPIMYKIGSKEVKDLILRLEGYVLNENPDRHEYKTVLLDVLYFVGLSLDDKKYFAAQGFDKFKELLREVIK